MKSEDDSKKNTSGRSAGKIIGRIIMVLLIIVILCCAALLIPRLFGIEEYAVVTGSMEPAIHVGSIVFVAQEDPEGLNPGDVIAYENEGASGIPVVHRVITNDRTAREIHTKGDANEMEDIFPVEYGRVRGKVVFVVPLIGRLFMH